MTSVDIVETAELFVREFGFRQLTIRSLAEAANDSKSQVEHAIGSMPQLTDALEERAAAHLFGAQTEFFVDRVVDQPEWCRMALVPRSGVPQRCTYAGLLYEAWGEAADSALSSRPCFEEFVRRSTGALAELILSLSAEPVVRESLGVISDQTFRLHRSVEALLRDAVPLSIAESGLGVPTPEVPDNAPTRDHVVHAATVLVKEHGIDKVSVRGIAEEANCGKSTVQSIVGDRASLVDVLRASARADFNDALSGLGSRESPDFRAAYLSKVVDYQQSNHYWALLAADRGSSWGTKVSMVRPGFAGTAAWKSPREVVGVADFVARSTGTALELAALFDKAVAVGMLSVTFDALVEAVSTLDGCLSPR